MKITPFLVFEGDCRDAMEFYKKCFTAHLFLLPRENGGITHATLSRGETILMAADSTAPVRRGNHSAVMIQCDSLEEIEDLFAALSKGGTVTMPLQDTFWNARFGALTDRFSIHWMLNCPIPPSSIM